MFATKIKNSMKENETTSDADASKSSDNQSASVSNESATIFSGEQAVAEFEKISRQKHSNKGLNSLMLGESGISRTNAEFLRERSI